MTTGGTASSGQVAVQGTDLLRDGQPWIPHGFHQIAFAEAPANVAKATRPNYGIAVRNYTPAEYTDMREWGADSVRIQLSQFGVDPDSDQFDHAFREQALEAVHAARQAGLTVIISLQNEVHAYRGVPPIPLPDAGTQNAWTEIASRFADDHGVLYELFNEPQPSPTPDNWMRWASAMHTTIATVRAQGASNVVVAGGLGRGQLLTGAPLLDDAQVAYASHPYANGPWEQGTAAWDAKFGDFAGQAPVIITEWNSGGYYCDADTPATTVQFLRYLQERRIGLQVVAWDWASGNFGSARWHFPDGRTTLFPGSHCHDDGHGLGATVQAWYTTGTPPDAPL